jgi:hypothetical protein
MDAVTLARCCTSSSSRAEQARFDQHPRWPLTRAQSMFMICSNRRAAVNTLLKPSQTDDANAIAIGLPLCGQGRCSRCSDPSRLGCSCGATQPPGTGRAGGLVCFIRVEFVTRPASEPSRERHEDQPVRHRRHFSANDSAILLAAICECRRACIAANTKAPIGGPIYRAATDNCRSRIAPAAGLPEYAG